MSNKSLKLKNGSVVVFKPSRDKEVFRGTGQSIIFYDTDENGFPVADKK